MGVNGFQYRYCCDGLWGEVVGSKDPRRPTDVVVDRPGKRKLFEECEWRHWMSAGAPYGQGCNSVDIFPQNPSQVVFEV